MSTRERYESVPYRELASIAMKYRIPGNIKKTDMIRAIIAHEDNNMEEVQKIIKESRENRNLKRKNQDPGKRKPQKKNFPFMVDVIFRPEQDGIPAVSTSSKNAYAPLPLLKRPKGMPRMVPLQQSHAIQNFTPYEEFMYSATDYPKSQYGYLDPQLHHITPQGRHAHSMFKQLHEEGYNGNMMDSLQTNMAYQAGVGLHPFGLNLPKYGRCSTPISYIPVPSPRFTTSPISSVAPFGVKSGSSTSAGPSSSVSDDMSSLYSPYYQHLPDSVNTVSSTISPTDAQNVTDDFSAMYPVQTENPSNSLYTSYNPFPNFVPPQFDPVCSVPNYSQNYYSDSNSYNTLINTNGYAGGTCATAVQNDEHLMLNCPPDMLPDVPLLNNDPEKSPSSTKGTISDAETRSDLQSTSRPSTPQSDSVFEEE